MNTVKRPELLAPAGSVDALNAAIRAGADAVYFGGTRFNARMSADNFSDREMEDAIRRCSFYGVRSNITLNTVPFEREMDDLLSYAEQLYRWGADALICADPGLASLLHRTFPDFLLHASTQCAGHNTDAALFFSKIGFSRMVAARELSYPDLKTLCSGSPIEIELFLHGAICVSQSGGCLFSSLVGGRSGNRGECAQPCRLPYRIAEREGDSGSPEGYPLSLRDLSLSGHIPELLSLGVASLKIEGRMKSPAYVEGVTRIFRRLLDEGRNADREETAFLSDLFSRNGFTDGYFTGKTGKEMLGVRSESDKERSAAAEKAVSAGRHPERTLPASLSCRIRSGAPIAMTASCRGCTVTETGSVPEIAKNREIREEDVRGCLSRLGETPFSAERICLEIDPALFVSLSELNALRRSLLSSLEQSLLRRTEKPERALSIQAVPEAEKSGDEPPRISQQPRRALFWFTERIPESAKDFYGLIFLPIDAFCADPEAALQAGVNAVALPPVIFDSEKDEIRKMTVLAAGRGIRHAMLSHPSHAALLREGEWELHGDFRMNCCTRETAAVLQSAGLADLCLSPELSLAQLRALRADIPLGAVTYGRIPLMTLQRCILRKDGAVECRRCESRPVSFLIDRRKTAFPVTRCFPHRNLVWNSVPVWSADRPVHGLGFTLHLFVTESRLQAEDVIRRYRADPGSDLSAPFSSFRRIR
ncbi:MAG: U32 family peptidase [Clostridia bacterium]|nr:U32 family peptidase [Clostridia bacterium]